jgi:hypothetical protein
MLISLAEYSHILSNVTGISFLLNNTMLISNTLRGNKIGTTLMPVIQGVGISPALTAPDVIGADYEHYGMKLVYLGIDSL